MTATITKLRPVTIRAQMLIAIAEAYDTASSGTAPNHDPITRRALLDEAEADLLSALEAVRTMREEG
jgi:hypothetical protein